MSETDNNSDCVKFARELFEKVASPNEILDEILRQKQPHVKYYWLVLNCLREAVEKAGDMPRLVIGELLEELIQISKFQAPIPSILFATCLPKTLWSGRWKRLILTSTLVQNAFCNAVAHILSQQMPTCRCQGKPHIQDETAVLLLEKLQTEMDDVADALIILDLSWRAITGDCKHALLKILYQKTRKKRKSLNTSAIESLDDLGKIFGGSVLDDFEKDKNLWVNCKFKAILAFVNSHQNDDQAKENLLIQLTLKELAEVQGHSDCQELKLFEREVDWSYIRTIITMAESEFFGSGKSSSPQGKKGKKFLIKTC